MKTSDFDNKFDDGQDITSFLDVKNAHRPALQQKRVNVDFPLWMANKIDKEALHLGVTRQSLIKLWIAHRFEHSPQPSH